MKKKWFCLSETKLFSFYRIFKKNENHQTNHHNLIQMNPFPEILDPPLLWPGCSLKLMYMVVKWRYCNVKWLQRTILTEGLLGNIKIAYVFHHPVQAKNINFNPEYLQSILLKSNFQFLAPSLAPDGDVKHNDVAPRNETWRQRSRIFLD